MKNKIIKLLQSENYEDVFLALHLIAKLPPQEILEFDNYRLGYSHAFPDKYSTKMGGYLETKEFCIAIWYSLRRITIESSNNTAVTGILSNEFNKL